jgi:Fur family ferric uptake transcriptional regulator
MYLKEGRKLRGRFNMQKDNCGEILDKDQLRKTKSRKLILKILKDSAPKTAEEIFFLVRAQNERTSLSTIYRTCETLMQKGIISKSNLIDDGKTRYEYCFMEHRHHAICMDCHKIIPVDDCPFGDFDKLMESKLDFDVKSHKLEIYGYCHDCRLNHSVKKNTTK